jgi:hypothetical protein
MDQTENKQSIDALLNDLADFGGAGGMIAVNKFIGRAQEIRAQLARQRQGEELGEVVPCEDYGITIRWVDGAIPPAGTKLYATPMLGQSQGDAEVGE